MFAIAAAAAAAASMCAAVLAWHARSAAATATREVLYAWDRPEDLRALMPADGNANTAVAVYAATVHLENDATVWRPRAHPIYLPEATPRIVVIHVEPAQPASARRRLDDALVAYLVDKIVPLARTPHVIELQLDYEAPVSERPFLRALVVALRGALGNDARLTMTALASWCLFDGWIADLPVDAAVPMVYRMGRDRDEVRRWFDAGNDFRVPVCRHDVAVSLADPPPRLPQGRGHFYFNPRSWTADDVGRVR